MSPALVAPAAALSGERVQTSFDRGIAGFTWLMIRFMVVMVSIVFLIVGLTKHDWSQALLFGLVFNHNGYALGNLLDILQRREVQPQVHVSALRKALDDGNASASCSRPAVIRIT